MTLSNLIRSAWLTADLSGWHTEPRTFGELIALAHSELSEALEAYRDGLPLSEFTSEGKPEGIAVELADVLIRIFDMSEELGIPLEDAIKAKMAYNKTRSYRHGGKKL
jgi:NTP pyrophosphatase (non-canonical NTP hydrolase)